MITVKLHGEGQFKEHRPKFASACAAANEILRESALWLSVQEKFKREFSDGFNFSYDLNGDKINFLQITEYFLSSHATIKINTYVPRWCLSRALAYTLPNDNTTYFNKNKFDHKMMTLQFITTIVLHEAVHIVDFALPDVEFGHGGNSGQHKPAKKRSAPIWISEALVAESSASIQPERSLKEKIMCEDFCETKKTPFFGG